MLSKFSVFSFQRVLTPGRLMAARRVFLTSIAAAIMLAFIVTPSVTAASAAATQYTAVPGGSLVITGTSTLHNWSVKSTSLVGDVTLTGHWADGAKSIRLRFIHLTIPVKSLKSSEGGGMDNTMYDALNRPQHPLISYQLTNATVDNAAARPGESVVFDTAGTLTVNGVARPVTLKLLVTRHNGNISISTSTILKMTDFGVKPPTAMFGIIRSGDVITVTAKWLLVKKKGT